MRKTLKSQLAKALTNDVQLLAERNARAICVIDGGAFLHKIKWAKKTTYKDIAMQYVEYVRTKYGQHSCNVFDGYEKGPSTKEQEHMRRAGKICAEIQLSESMEVLINQQTFFLMKEIKVSSLHC